MLWMGFLKSIIIIGYYARFPLATLLTIQHLFYVFIILYGW